MEIHADESLGHSLNNALRGSVILLFSAVSEMDAESILVSRSTLRNFPGPLLISPAGSWKNSQFEIS